MFTLVSKGVSKNLSGFLFLVGLMAIEVIAVHPAFAEEESPEGISDESLEEMYSTPEARKKLERSEAKLAQELSGKTCKKRDVSLSVKFFTLAQTQVDLYNLTDKQAYKNNALESARIAFTCDSSNQAARRLVRELE